MTRHCQPLDKSSCIFCNEQNGHLHEFRMLDADENVRRMATDLQDTVLLSTTEGGDLVALDAKYHLACLAGLRNRHRSFIRQNQDSHSSHTEDMKTQARAFVELITYVENAVEIMKCDCIDFDEGCQNCLRGNLQIQRIQFQWLIPL